MIGFVDVISEKIATLCPQCCQYHIRARLSSHIPQRAQSRRFVSSLLQHGIVSHEGSLARAAPRCAALCDSSLRADGGNAMYAGGRELRHRDRYGRRIVDVAVRCRLFGRNFRFEGPGAALRTALPDYANLRHQHSNEMGRLERAAFDSTHRPQCVVYRCVLYIN